MAKVKFTPTTHYKTDKDGNYVLDDKKCKIKLDDYKSIKFEEMIAFLKENATEEQKAAFKAACHTQKVYDVVIGKKGGKKKVWNGETTECTEINPYYAKEWFCKEFAPELLPKAATKKQEPSMEDLLADL